MLNSSSIKENNCERQYLKLTKLLKNIVYLRVYLKWPRFSDVKLPAWKTKKVQKKNKIV